MLVSSPATKRTWNHTMRKQHLSATSVQNSEKTHFCSSHLVCGILLWQLELRQWVILSACPINQLVLKSDNMLPSQTPERITPLPVWSCISTIKHIKVSYSFIGFFAIHLYVTIRLFWKNFPFGNTIDGKGWGSVWCYLELQESHIGTPKWSLGSIYNLSFHSYFAVGFIRCWLKSEPSKH